MASRSPPQAGPKLRILHLAPPAGLSKGLSALDLPVLPTLGGTSERLTTSADSPAQPKPGGGECGRFCRADDDADREPAQGAEQT